MELDAILHRARGLVDDRVVPLSARDTDYVEYLNRGIREAAERSLCLRDSYTITLTPGTHEYTLPETAVRPESIVVQRVYDADGKVLAKSNFENMEAWHQKNTEQDTPTIFAQRDQTLILRPVPDAAITITVSGVWYPLATMSMDAPEAEPELPSHVHDDLAHWLAYEAIIASDAGDTREERRTRLADRHLAFFTRRFGPARSAREINQWREVPQERFVRGPGTV